MLKLCFVENSPNSRLKLLVKIHQIAKKNQSENRKKNIEFSGH